MIGLFKYLIAALALFAAYDEFVLTHRVSAFNAVELRSPREAVTAAIGAPKHVYSCKEGGTPASFLMYIDGLCKGNAVEVDAYPLCYIPFRCQGWNYVAYDDKGQVLSKYRFSDQ